MSPVPRRGASVVTVHDVAQVALPDPRWLAWRKNLRWRLRFRRSARVATLMLADDDPPLLAVMAELLTAAMPSFRGRLDVATNPICARWSVRCGSGCARSCGEGALRVASGAALETEPPSYGTTP